MNIKIKKKILVCMLWLCAIACFTGFPWIFFSWDVIHSYMGIHDIPSDLTIVLFREECLFFGFFCIYFLFLRNIEKYKGLISFCSFLVAFMGGFMYLLKLQNKKVIVLCLAVLEYKQIYYLKMPYQGVILLLSLYTTT